MLETVFQVGKRKQGLRTQELTKFNGDPICTAVSSEKQN